jgi:hypothetical protein
VAFNLVGDVLVIGATGTPGSAYIYTGTPGSAPYTLSATLTINAPGFGRSVAISDVGDVVVVGAPQIDSLVGAAYVFRKPATGNWIEEANLKPTDNVGASQYGSSVALSGDGSTVAVGGHRDDDDKGAVWMYKYVSDAWYAYSGGKLLASGLVTPPPQFGIAVGLDTTGTILAGGAPEVGTINGNEARRGAVFIFTYAAATWTKTQLIPAPASCVGRAYLDRTNVQFGLSLSLNGDASVLAIGAPNDVQLGDQVGSVYVYKLSGGSILENQDVYKLSDGSYVENQGPIVGNDYVGDPFTGNAVALSKDSEKLFFAGYYDNDEEGSVSTRERMCMHVSGQSACLISLTIPFLSFSLSLPHQHNRFGFLAWRHPSSALT